MCCWVLGVRCLLAVVVCCWLLVVCCLAFDLDCCELFDVLAVRCSLIRVCWLLVVGCWLLFVLVAFCCHAWFVDRCVVCV